MFDEFPDVLSVPQVAQALHIGKQAVYNLVKNSKIHHLQIGKNIRIPKICLIEYVSSAQLQSGKL